MSNITKKAIEEALKKILLEKSLNKITINDIAEECGISRMTFYYHFKDIYDLVEYSCVEEANKILKGKKTYETWQEGFLDIFEALIDNKVFIMNVYNSISRDQLEINLYKMVYKLMIAVVEEQSKKFSVLEKDKKFIADFYKYALVGLLLDWIKNGMKTNPKEIVKQLDLLVHGNIATALSNYESERKSRI